MQTWKFSLLTEQETQVDWWQFQEVATFTFTFCGTIESNKTILSVLLFNNILSSHWWKNRKFTLWLHRIPVLASTHIIFLFLMPNFATISPRFLIKIFHIFCPTLNVFWIVVYSMFWFSIANSTKRRRRRLKEDLWERPTLPVALCPNVHHYHQHHQDLFVHHYHHQ